MEELEEMASLDRLRRLVADLRGEEMSISAGRVAEFWGLPSVGWRRATRCFPLTVLSSVSREISCLATFDRNGLAECSRDKTKPVDTADIVAIVAGIDACQHNRASVHNTQDRLQTRQNGGERLCPALRASRIKLRTKKLAESE